MNRSRLQFSIKASPGMPTVLCLPGTMCSPAIFDQVMSRDNLPAQYVRVSWMTSPGPWDMDALGERTIALIRECDMGPAYLVGHSTGGTIALVAALKEPSLVRGLLLANTGANMKGHGDVSSIIHAIKEEWGQDLWVRILKRCFYYEQEPDFMQTLLSYAAALQQEVALSALESQFELDLEPELSNVVPPVVIAHGIHDQARPIAQAELLAERIPRAELVPLDAGHTPMVENPEGFSKALHQLVDMERKTR